MLLEDFARYLQSFDASVPATEVLACWLWEKINTPASGAYDRALQQEIKIEPDDLGDRPGMLVYSPAKALSQVERLDPDEGSLALAYIFTGTSPSGQKLLNSLYQFAQSYEQQKWSRWVHKVKASDFCDP
jgi:hypothetical protein